jgi:hypothetical protein
MSGPFTLGPWVPGTPRPSDAENCKGAWLLADMAVERSARLVRCLWDGDAVAMLGGIVPTEKGNGLAFLWQRDGLPRMTWRHVWHAVVAGIWAAHEMGIRRVCAVVEARFAQGHTLMRRLGFEPLGPELGYAGIEAPMLRYAHCSPAFEQPALVRHLQRELHLACLASWCPEAVEDWS